MHYINHKHDKSQLSVALLTQPTTHCFLNSIGSGSQSGSGIDTDAVVLGQECQEVALSQELELMQCLALHGSQSGSGSQQARQLQEQY